MLHQLFSALLVALMILAASVSAAPALEDPDFSMQFDKTLPLRAMRSSFGGMAPMVGRHGGLRPTFYVIDGRPYRVSK